jgi:hypothetical protein
MNGPEIKWGYGDEETWGPYAGHPNDPRAPDEDEADEDWEPDWESIAEARAESRAAKYY